MASAEAAAKLGHPRAEIGGRHCVARVLTEMGRYSEALPELDKSLALIRRLQAGRFEAQNICFRADAYWELGRRDEALADLDTALKLARRTGLKFICPSVLGSLSRRTSDAAARKRAIQEAEEILSGGAVGHNVYWFYRDVMLGSAERNEWDQVRYCADMLEKYTEAEPLPWSDFYISWGRALAGLYEGGRGSVKSGELTRLREIATKAGFHAGLEPVQEGLSLLQTAR